MAKITRDDKVCIHRGKCVATLPKVFRIEDGKFVIDESGGTDEEIGAAVAQCPSGALKTEKR